MPIVIAQKAVRRLGLQRMHARIPVQGLDNKTSGISREWVSLQLASRDNSSVQY